MEQIMAREWLEKQDLGIWCVYGLADVDGTIIYVGKTREPYARLQHHWKIDHSELRFGGKLDHVAWVESGLTAHEACMMEEHLYDRYEPIYNAVRPHCDCRARRLRLSMKKLIERFGRK